MVALNYSAIMFKVLAIAACQCVIAQTAFGGDWQLVATNLDLGLYTNHSTSKLDIRFLSGTLAEHITTNLAARMAHRNPNRDLEMFSSSLIETTNIVRHPGFWLADLPEVTAFCAVRRYTLRFSGNASYYPNATLLTRRHILQVKHNRSPVGSGVVYVSRDNRRVVRRIIDWQPVGNCDTNTFSNWSNDCNIVQLLNEPVPAEFTPLKLLPRASDAYFSEFAPRLFGHHTKTFGVVCLIDRPFLNHRCTNIFYPFGVDRPEWFRPAVGGDSGASAEYVIDGHLVLMYRNSHEIVRAIETLNARHGTKEVPQEIDLSRFPKIR